MFVNLFYTRPGTPGQPGENRNIYDLSLTHDLKIDIRDSNFMP